MTWDWSRLGGHPVGLWLIKHVISPLDRGVVRVTRGRLPLPTSLIFPTLLLTSRGRRTGLERTVPLIYVRDGSSYVVANARPDGERKNPWVLNLAAADDAVILVKKSRIRVQVQLLDETEAEQLWPRIIAIWPALDRFYQKTGDRWVFRLEPRGGTELG